MHEQVLFSKHTRAQCEELMPRLQSVFFKKPSEQANRGSGAALRSTLTVGGVCRSCHDYSVRLDAHRKACSENPKCALRAPLQSQSASQTLFRGGRGVSAAFLCGLWENFGSPNFLVGRLRTRGV